MITRPHVQGQALGRYLKQYHAIVNYLPCLAYAKTFNKSCLNQAKNQLGQVDFAIFCSQEAVKKVFTSPPPNHLKTKLQIIALGLSTAKHLKNLGFKNIQVPTELPFNSEKILQMDCLNFVKNKVIHIYRASLGREFLAQALGARGAKIFSIEAYRSVNPFNKKRDNLNIYPLTSNVVIFTSSQALLNGLMLGSDFKTFLLNTTLIVVGERNWRNAIDLGFKNLIMARGADHQSIYQALCQWNLTSSHPLHRWDS